MMANPEMPGAQEEAAAEAVQAGGTSWAGSVGSVGSVSSVGEAVQATAAPATAATPEVPRPRRESVDGDHQVGGAAQPSQPVQAAQPAQPPQAAQAAEARKPAEARQPAEARRRSPASYEPEPERMPLTARVLLADFAVAVAALILLFVIEVQRFGDARLHLRREAWAEDLIVLFAVTAVFGVVTALLVRAKHARVAIVQAVVTALVLVAAVTSAATGDPKPTSADLPTSTGSSGNPG